MKKRSFIIATRESPLALWQAHHVKTGLEKLYPGLDVQLLGLTTSADKMLSTPLYKVGGKGLFVKELEEALLDGRADLAVHSMKDVPMVLPAELCVPVMGEREDPRDVLVSNHIHSFSGLPTRAVLGTSSLRRQSQVLALRPDLQVTFLRGNVNTRLAKLDAGEFSAIILAAAGLKRLGLAERISAFVAVEDVLPAAGQGVSGIECRLDDEETQKLIAPLNHQISHLCVIAERAMCRYLDAGCQVPVGAYAQIKQDQLFLRGLVARPDGTVILRAAQRGPVAEAEKLGEKVAVDLLQQGAGEILDELRH